MITPTQDTDCSRFISALAYLGDDVSQRLDSIAQAMHAEVCRSHQVTGRALAPRRFEIKALAQDVKDVAGELRRVREQFVGPRA